MTRSAHIARSRDFLRARVRWNSWALAPILLAGTACAVPWLLAHIPEIGLALQRGFALACHQNAHRSFVLCSGSVAVCARCLGIYLGAAVGLLLRVPRQLAFRLFIAAFAFNAGDWLTEAAGLHGNWMLTRFVLGCVLGAAGAMLVTSAASPVFEPSVPGRTFPA